MYPRYMALLALVTALAASSAPAVAQDLEDQSSVLPQPAGGWGQASDASDAKDNGASATIRGRHNHYILVEEFTASTLAQGEVKLGTDFDIGLSDDIMIGTDVVAAAIGATTLYTKWLFYQSNAHSFALGLRAAYLSDKTVLWGSVKNHFDELDARVLRPSLSWTNIVSSRLNLHMFWAKGLGKIRVRLSEKGRRTLWQAKHPGANYDERDLDTQAPTSAGGTTAVDSNNQEKASSEKSSLSQQSLQVQSIAELAQDRFQMTGEIARRNGNKVLISCRIEQTELEELKSNFFRLTAAHQWIWSSFQMRLGVGMQYIAMSGRDLDGEKIDEDGVLPASDIGFYWRF